MKAIYLPDIKLLTLISLLVQLGMHFLILRDRPFGSYVNRSPAYSADVQKIPQLFLQQSNSPTAVWIRQGKKFLWMLLSRL